MTLLLSLLCGGLPGTAASQPRGPQASPVEPGLTADQIKQAQEALKLEGFSQGSIDGRLGPRTRQALRAYQARAGLPQTGDLDDATFPRLAPLAPCAQEGLAAWLGTAFEGRQTASGAQFSAAARTAAHRTLPFGTPVRVTNLQTGQAVEVTIIDRGPKTKEHLIDLSQAAAEQIGLRRRGELQVQVAVLAPECSR